MRLIFIRHGDPDYIHDALTEKGKREAAALAERVAEWDVKQIYCSPLGRAKATCAAAEARSGRKAIICDWLREFQVEQSDVPAGEHPWPWDLSPVEWTSVPEYLSVDHWSETVYMRVRSADVMYNEVTTAFDQLMASYGYVRNGGMYNCEKPNDDTLVFFTHHGLTCVLMAHVMNVSPVILWHSLFMPPASVTIAASEEVIEHEAFFRFQSIGDVSHLKLAGEPISSAGYFADFLQK